MDPERKTPPGRLITTGEQQILTQAGRSFLKPIIPHMPALAAHAGTAVVALLVATLHTRSTKQDADKKVDKVDARAEAGYDKLGPEYNNLLLKSKAQDVAIARLTDTVELQGRLLLASRPGFTPEGRPETIAPAGPRARQRRPDPVLVKKVADNATKGLAAIKLAVTKPATPEPKPVPPTLDQLTGEKPQQPPVTNLPTPHDASVSKS